MHYRQANNVLFNRVTPQQHYPQYVYQQPQAQVRYQPQVQYIQQPVQYLQYQYPAQYVQYQHPQQVQNVQQQRKAYARKAYAIPKKQYVRNPWNGGTYSFESYDPNGYERSLYRQGFVKYKDGNYYNINNHQAYNPYTGTICIFK